ncbi:HpcH/HpaI aldolase family protein [Microbaculum marinum]|uniref:Aldolase/citrate lyase family protein n=1 Tax=Microbaculum marinum TaxID=1764581 RepID=A0AAW9RX61_9HYPH
MSNQTMRAMARTRSLKVGHFIVEFATPGIGYILRNAGCDFVLFDTEHSGFHNETIKSALRYFEAASLPAIVRVPSKEYHHIARALDMGAEGLMVPMVNDAAEARAILDCMKYTPAGKRGVALGVAHDKYATGAVLDKLAAANERSTLFAQIETAEGVENVEEIAATDGVDCLWVGHFDLSASLGIPGQFEHRKFKDAIARTIAAGRSHGKAVGRLVPDTKSGIDLFSEGFDFICYSGDVWVLQTALTAAVGEIRAGCGRGSAGSKRAARGKAVRGKASPKKAGPKQVAARTGAAKTAATSAKSAKPKKPAAKRARSGGGKKAG